MKDPIIADMVAELRELIEQINIINKKLYDNDVSYRLEDTYDEEQQSKQLEIRHLQQKVEY